MLLNNFILSLCWATAATFSLAAAGVAPFTGNLQVRNAAGMEPRDTLESLRRAISSVALSERDKKYSNSTSLDMSFNGITLFS
jgi:hypothetical protein